MSAWVRQQELLRAAGFTERTLRRKVAAGEILARDGEAAREYSTETLPAKVRAKLEPTPIAQSPNFTQALEPFNAEKVAFLDAEDERQARERFAILEPLVKFDTEPSRFSHLQLSDGTPVTSSSRMALYLCAKHGVGQRTLWDWAKRYRDGGLVALSNRTRSDKGKRRFFEQNQSAAIFVAAKYWNERLNVRTIYRALKRDAHLMGITPEDLPSYETTRAYLEGLPKAPAILGRRGERAFNEQCLPYLSREYGEGANQIWVSDHMIADVLTWDDLFARDAQPMRMRLTMILDFRTRKAVGHTFCQEGSSWSITTALRNAMLQYGPCETFYCDNGKDYRKVAKGAAPTPWWTDEMAKLTGLLDRLGMRAQHCLRYHPQSKHVERFFGTVHSQFDAKFTAGYTTGTPFLRPDCTNLAVKEHHRMRKAGEVEGSPLPAASVYVAAFNAWVEQEYNNAPHSGKGMNGRSPNQVFDEQLPAEQRRTIDLAQMAHLFYDSARRKVDSCGVVLDRVRYSGFGEEDSAQLLMHTGRTVEIRYDRNDPSTAVAIDDAGRLVARLRPESLLPQSSNAQPMIAASMAERRRLQKSVTRLVRGVQQQTTINGHLTERQHLELAAGLAAEPSSTALSLVTHRKYKPKPNDADMAPPSAADIAANFLEALK